MRTSIKLNPRVLPAPAGMEGKYYVALGRDPSRYLHSDGIWRESTFHNGAYTGYFPSKQVAEAALKSSS